MATSAPSGTPAAGLTSRIRTIAEGRTSRTLASRCRITRGGWRVDAALPELADLWLEHVRAVFLVRVRRAIEVQVLRIDVLLVDEAVLLGGEVLHPVAPAGVRAEAAQGVDVDRARHPR